MYLLMVDMDSRYLIIIFSTIVSTSAYPYFATKIPNGESVPHPCRPNYMWPGVGHENKNGGGARNPFGIDFYNAGKTWTPSLCSKDSDGDGMTNGEELGDPHCLWSEGTVPEKLTGISHPGVCQPMDSVKCHGKNDWVDCSNEEFTCEALQNDPGCVNQTVKFPQTRVPANETNYFCMAFDFKQDGDYHIIATEPLIDNIQVMHHILLYGCKHRPRISPNIAAPCGMELADCRDIIGLWTVGSTGDCFHDQIGFRIGQYGYKHGVMQFHWNNPELRSDYTDESGMVLHYTPNMRIHDAGVLSVGNMYIEIPPQSDQLAVEANCKVDTVNGPIYISRALNHMHYLGRQMKIEHYRNGLKLRDITLEDNYSYDSPKYFRYNDAIEVRSGDSLKTTCVYKSWSRTKTVFYGEGTNEEMCFGFLTFHPSNNYIKDHFCGNWKTLNYHTIYQSEEIHKCRHWDFLLSSTTEIRSLKARVQENCKELTNCLSECHAVVKDVQHHPCMVGDIGAWIKEQVRVKEDSRINYTEMMAFYRAISTCDKRMEMGRCQSASSKSTMLSYFNLSFVMSITLITLGKATI